MFVLSQFLLDVNHPNTRNIDVPTVQVVSLGKCGENTGVDRICINDFELREPDPLFKS